MIDITLIISGIVGILILFLVIRIIILKEKALDTTSLIGVCLTAAGIFIIIFYNKFLKTIGASTATETITPSDLKKIIDAEQIKIKEEKLNELKKKTPDNIINNELPDDARNSVRTTINDGKRKLRNLFYPGRIRTDDTKNGTDT